ncbi:MAG: FAD-dependent oxidoreductase [Candidatus Nanopelagicales bacterium]
MHRRDFLAITVGALTAPVLLRASDASATSRRVPAPLASLVTRWDTDPWSRGSYSALPAGVSPSVRRTLSDAILGGRIVLAGEYASTSYPATTNGAYLSGQHAARRILSRRDARSAIARVHAAMPPASPRRAPHWRPPSRAEAPPTNHAPVGTMEW